MIQTKINKWGNSLGFRLPKKIVDDLGLSEDQTVMITLVSGKVVLTPKFVKPTLSDLLSKVNSKNRPEKIYLDKPSGRELW
jgi:antitoxin MazE